MIDYLLIPLMLIGIGFCIWWLCSKEDDKEKELKKEVEDE